MRGFTKQFSNNRGWIKVRCPHHRCDINKKRKNRTHSKSDYSIALHHSSIVQNIQNYPVEGAQRAQPNFIQSHWMNRILSRWYVFAMYCYNAFKLRTHFRNCCVIKHPPPHHFWSKQNVTYDFKVLQLFRYIVCAHHHYAVFFSWLACSHFSCASRTHTHKIKVASPSKQNAYRMKESEKKKVK